MKGRPTTRYAALLLTNEKTIFRCHNKLDSSYLCGVLDWGVKTVGPNGRNAIALRFSLCTPCPTQAQCAPSFFLGLLWFDRLLDPQIRSAKLYQPGIRVSNATCRWALLVMSQQLPSIKELEQGESLSCLQWPMKLQTSSCAYDCFYAGLRVRTCTCSIFSSLDWPFYNLQTWWVP